MTRLALLSLLAATTFSSAFARPAVSVAPDAQTVIADVNAINAGVVNLNQNLEAYQGGVLSQTPIVGDFLEIEVANRKGYADANLASPFSPSDSTALVNDVIATVGITIPQSIQTLKSKKPLFEAAGEDGVIVSTLKVLLYDHDTFSAAVGAKLTADQAAAIAVVAEIHNSIQSGIDYFSS